AIDLGGRKIRVNSVHPGPIDTDMIAFRTPEQREERMRQVPMHRRGMPKEVAQLVAFLLSDELWASALREVKARMRPLFQQERICLLRSMSSQESLHMKCTLGCRIGLLLLHGAGTARGAAECHTRLAHRRIQMTNALFHLIRPVV